MEFLEYFKEKVIFILVHLCVLIFTSILLNALGVGTYAIVFTVFLNFIGSIIFYLYDFYNKRKYYKGIYETLGSLEKKYIISDMIEEATFLEGKILYDIVSQTDKSMNDKISTFISDNQEYQEYIELWVHEIKTPIAATKLLIENNRTNITDSIEEEIEKIENFIEQTLFYAKSNEVEKDYIIKKFNIRKSINAAIKKNANSLIQNKVKVVVENCDADVYSDNKWLEFILHQIISNSIKYMKKNEKILSIYCEKNDNDVVLYIEDNGIGISEKSLMKAFDKGYTGENGRIFGESTGIGLYLCKKLCNKLGLSIMIKSKENQGTTVSILFPKNNMLIFD
ncbi:ATP-binding protein [Clostridium frigidicarnis]|uniref:histidine kinase n=1 Tax=Clostridium frigidicarnis TaxID=84698 RepID=A0A1I0X8C7_9CLOT|nr:ATP-binding protein [Clostridium frigidicarnis]SFA97285.1 hypothetical protein SAMN04488528_1007150 [Clostridium frigidicarnis]